MNREIKFRAWNKRNKKMYYKVMVGMWGSKEVMDDENYTACMIYEYSNDNPKIGEWLHFEPCDDMELMEYTGHKDKNGKEIYEGDIIVYWDGVEERYKLAVIKFDEGSFIMINDRISWNIYLTDENDEIKIVGNICENKDLLKEV